MLRKSGGALWRAYQLKETLRAVFAGDLETPIVLELFGSLVFPRATIAYP